jgi:3-dehydroquinate synthase
MTPIAVDLGERSYAVHVARGALASTLPSVLAAIGAARVVVVSSPRVFRHHGARLHEALGPGLAPVLVGDGEAKKTPRTVERIHDAFADAGLGRDGVVLAFGGGVVGDMAGFAAATYMRGVAWVPLPTTLLAMADASIGGKVGVNHRTAKNLVGAFHQPRAVVADTDTLATLPTREMRSGAYEILKCGILGDPALFAALAAAPARLARWPALEDAVARACAIKAAVVSADETDSGRRLLLNLGHTVGHALETVTAYRRLTHGEAVGWGMAAAAWIASARGMLDAAARDAILGAIDHLGSRPGVADLDAGAVMAALAHDKKALSGRVRFVLPTAIGACTIADDVTGDEVAAALRRLGTG